MCKSLAFTWRNSFQYLSVCVLVLVFNACIKHDYFWINGDDPNLLLQGFFVSRGYIPNIDFFSGYPGLGIYIYSILVGLVGFNPLAQHVYAAIQFILLAILFFSPGFRVRPVIAFVFFGFAYSQTLNLNPTPNPGYLFDVFFIAGLLKLDMYLKEGRKIGLYISASLFAVSFLSKQYGVFGLITLVQALIINASVSRVTKFTLIITLQFIIIACSCFLYFGSSSPQNIHHDLLTQNYTVFLAPVILTLYLFYYVVFVKGINASTGCNASELIDNFKPSFEAATIYLITIVGFMVAIYGYRSFFDVFREILFLAPKQINGFVIPVNFDINSNAKALSGLMLLISIVYLSVKINISAIFLAPGIIIAVFIVRKIGFDGTVFLSLAYSILAILSTHNSIKKKSLAPMSFIVPLSSMLLILTPFPNYAYHVPILCILFMQQIGIACDLNNVCIDYKKLKISNLLIIFALSSVVVASSFFATSNLQYYTFNTLRFKSGDKRWIDSTAEATSYISSRSPCENAGCKYLVIADSPVLTDINLIEKPIWVR